MHFITRVSRFFDNNVVTLSWIAIRFQHNVFTSLRNIQFIFHIFNDFTNEFTPMNLVIFPDSRPRIRIKVISSVTFLRLFCTYPLYVGKQMNELQSGNGQQFTKTCVMDIELQQRRNNILIFNGTYIFTILTTKN